MAGRSKGYRKPKENYLTEYKQEIRLLSFGVPVREISRLTGRSINTIKKLKHLK